MFWLVLAYVGTCWAWHGMFGPSVHKLPNFALSCAFFVHFGQHQPWWSFLGLAVLPDGENLGVSISAFTCLAEYHSTGKWWYWKASGRQNMGLLEAIFNDSDAETCTNNKLRFPVQSQPNNWRDQRKDGGWVWLAAPFVHSNQGPSSRPFTLYSVHFLLHRGESLGPFEQPNFFKAWMYQGAGNMPEGSLLMLTYSFQGYVILQTPYSI